MKQGSPACRGELALSRQARSLWGKSDYGGGVLWLPLYMHMLDAAGLAGHLWDEWLPEGTRGVLTAAMGDDSQQARRFACFIAGVHDIGKATPAFQGMARSFGADGEETDLSWKPLRAGLPMGCGGSRRTTAHPCASHIILYNILVYAYGWDARCAESVAAVVGSHHGKPPELKDVSRHVCEKPSQLCDLGWDAGCSDAWTSAQGELVRLVARAVGLSREDLESLAHTFVSAPAASLLTGFVIMVDWLASDQALFPLIELVPSECVDDDGDDEWSGAQEAHTRCEPRTWDDVDAVVGRSWARLDLIPAWHASVVSLASSDELFRSRFGLTGARRPRPMQQAAVEVARSVATPGLMIVEAPMGEGKTEAALAAAELMAQRTGRGGVCVALPTMATTDAMFGRVHRWLEHLPHGDGERSGGARSMFLAHGKARLNEEFQGIARAGAFGTCGPMGEDMPCEQGELPDRAVVSQWMQGRKKGMLANFVVCTVDQVLMGALQMKHLPLRHLALANKVVIIDECHAYDSYMRCYLNCVLGWLGGMGVPVVLLSATLPAEQRQEMVHSYQEGASCAQCRRSGMEAVGGSAPAAAPVPEAPLRPRRRFSSDRPAASVAAAANAVEKPRETTGLTMEGSAEPYPLITYTDGAAVHQVAPQPSGRASQVGLNLMPDDDGALVALLRERLAEGGCAGVICDVVTRAQHAAAILREAFGEDTVMLAHARFTDLDRMANETRLRKLLGPEATDENGSRPARLIVVGTQVLEQSLDIDFDVMVSDVAPVDLVMQRLGRLHRHERPRPVPLAQATCWVRGIDRWNEDGPVFSKGIERVYPTATLLEALGVLGLTGTGETCTAHLPADIARTVRDAYGGRAALPPSWEERYGREREKRADRVARQRARARACLLGDVEPMVVNRRSLVDWYAPQNLVGHDQDRGPRAVRDTGETVEVLALELRQGEVHLLPWVGDASCGVEPGARVDAAWEPDGAVARLAAQSAVRLPQSLCRPDEIEELIGELERACGPYVGAWQRSPWLAGCLALLLERDEEGALRTMVRGRSVRYSREDGLVVE